MNQINNIVEPQRILLTWQAPEGSPRRTRRVVAEIIQDGDGGCLHYLQDSVDYREAVADGFLGHPAFDPQSGEHRHVMDILGTRLPPRKRDDFTEFLQQHRLPASFNGSDFALFAYAGGKLPGDEFSVVPDLEHLSPPFEWVIEIAGFRHSAECSISELKIGDGVEFRLEVDNPVDKDAVAVFHDGRRIGYVNRAIRQALWRRVCAGRASAVIDKLNGRPDRPLVYLFLTVS